MGLTLMTTGMMQEVLQLSFLDELVQVVPKVPAILRGIRVVLVVLTIKVLIALCGLSGHLIWPSKVWLALDLLQHPVYWFLEYSVNNLRVGCFGLPYEISHRAVAVVLVRPEIPHFLGDNLLFSFTLQLVFLYSFIFVNPVHQLVHTGGRFACQRLPQVVLGREATFEGADGDFVKIAFQFVKHFPITVRVGF